MYEYDNTVDSRLSGHPDSVINVRLEVESWAETSSVFTVKKGLLEKMEELGEL